MINKNKDSKPRQNSPGKLFLIIKLAAVFFLALVIFALYKLVALSGISLLLILSTAIVLVFMVAYCFKQSADKIIIRGKEGLLLLPQQELSSWMQKRYKLINLFLGYSLIFSLGLVSLGASLIWLCIARAKYDVTDIVLSCFGTIIFFLGIYFSIMAISEFRFTVKRRTAIMLKMYEQINKPQPS